jgi:hypothetical protein
MPRLSDPITDNTSPDRQRYLYPTQKAQHKDSETQGGNAQYHPK